MVFSPFKLFTLESLGCLQYYPQTRVSVTARFKHSQQIRPRLLYPRDSEIVCGEQPAIPAAYSAGKGSNLILFICKVCLKFQVGRSYCSTPHTNHPKLKLPAGPASSSLSFVHMLSN